MKEWLGQEAVIIGPPKYTYSPGMDSRLYFSDDESSVSLLSHNFGGLASGVCKYEYEELRLDGELGLLILLARKRRIRPLRNGAIVPGSYSKQYIIPPMHAQNKATCNIIRQVFHLSSLPRTNVHARGQWNSLFVFVRSEPLRQFVCHTTCMQGSCVHMDT